MKPSTDPKTAAIRQLLQCYAIPYIRLSNPRRCAPSQDELAAHPNENVSLKGNTNKIMFAGEREAGGFCTAVMSLGDGDDLEPYPCPRGGHWHVRNIAKNRANRSRYEQAAGE